MVEAVHCGEYATRRALRTEGLEPKFEADLSLTWISKA